MRHLEYGRSTAFKNSASVLDELKLLPLHWHELKLDSWDGWRAAIAGTESTAQSGVYAYEGWLDTQAARSILYIGRAVRTLRERLTDEPGSWGLFAERYGNRTDPFSHVDEVVLRWAPVLDIDLIEVVEMALIAAHSPAFNNHDVTKNVTGAARQLVVLNCGRKGRLLPAVVGAYYTTAAGVWPPTNAER